MKKGILSIMITICMICVLMPTTVFAATTTDGQFEYSESDGNITITKYKGSNNVVEIPSKLDGNFPVTSIGNEAFKDCTGLTNITIPDSVTSIGERAFENCISLTSVTIPNSVTSIGEFVFCNCTSLTSIDIPNSLTSIATGALYRCTSLTSVKIPSSITSINMSAFGWCTSLTSIDIPNSVTSIANDVFGYCSSLKSVTIPNSVTSIGAYTFQYCTSLESMEIPNGVNSIGTEAFRDCEKLKSVTIPGSVKSIGSYAFQKCISLTRLVIHNGVSSIEQDAFRNCSSLTNVTIPDSVTSINNNLFQDCTSLTNVTIPNSVTSIGQYVFKNCKSLGSIDIPDSVTSIKAGAFNGCPSLESIFLPDGLNVSNASIRGEATKVRYHLTNGEVTITEINLGNNKNNVDIPAKVCGYDVVAVADGLLDKIGSHTHVGGHATCQTEATCEICNTKYGDKGHSYKWKHENGKYWKKCQNCGDETGKKDIPVISIDGANSICVTQDYEFSFSLPENVINATYGYEFKNKGEGGLDPTVKNDKMFAIIPSNIYETDNDSFKIIIQAKTVDDFDFFVSKIITMHTDIEPKDHICDICGTTLSQHSGGTATCTSQAICEYCGEKYGKLDSSNHHLEKVPAKESTVTEVGNKEYWYCKDCGKYFLDQDGKKSIELKNTITQKLSPQMIEGIGQSITVGEEKDLVFRSNAAFSDFVRVELDGKILDEKYYTVKEGSTIVTLKADYVSTLSSGEHTIGIVSENGTATIAFNVEAKANNHSPVTGDHQHMLLWIGLLLISGITMMLNKKYSEY